MLAKSSGRYTPKTWPEPARNTVTKGPLPFTAESNEGADCPMCGEDNSNEKDIFLGNILLSVSRIVAFKISPPTNFVFG